MNRPVFCLAATLALVGGSHASVIVDNFESYSSVGDTMQGKGGWNVSNGAPAVPGAPNFDGPVVILHDYTWDASAQSATVGGIEPTIAGLTSLYHSASVPFVSLTPTPTSFKFETAYTESDINYPKRNNFQFVLTASSGNLLTIDFTPGGAGEYDIAWSSAFATGGPIGAKSANVSTQFQFDMWASGANVGYNFSNAGTSISTGILTGGAMQSDLITEFRVNWDSTSNTGFGNNYITIDNVSLVPEPSSALLGMLGASFVFLRRRKA